jgi:hypothetical protein
LKELQVVVPKLVIASEDEQNELTSGTNDVKPVLSQNLRAKKNKTTVIRKTKTAAKKKMQLKIRLPKIEKHRSRSPAQQTPQQIHFNLNSKIDIYKIQQMQNGRVYLTKCRLPVVSVSTQTDNSLQTTQGTQTDEIKEQITDNCNEITVLQDSNAENQIPEGGHFQQLADLKQTGARNPLQSLCISEDVDESVFTVMESVCSIINDCMDPVTQGRPESALKRLNSIENVGDSELKLDLSITKVQHRVMDLPLAVSTPFVVRNVERLEQRDSSSELDIFDRLMLEVNNIIFQG